MDKYEKIAWIWIIAGFLGLIGLGYAYNGDFESLEVVILLVFTIVAFVLGLHLIMHDYDKEVKKKDE